MEHLGSRKIRGTLAGIRYMFRIYEWLSIYTEIKQKAKNTSHDLLFYHSFHILLKERISKIEIL